MGLFGFGKSREEKEPEEEHPLVRALKEGGDVAERAFDVLQGKLGPIFRTGGSDAVTAFCEFYDITCESGNPDSARRFAARFLPLLPERDRKNAEHRCGLDGSPGSEAAQYLKKREEALNDLANTMQSVGLFDMVAETLKKELEAEMRAGGASGRQRYVETCARLEQKGTLAELRKFERTYFPMLPRADRDLLLRDMVQNLKGDPEFIRTTRGLDERAVLTLVENSLLAEE